MAKKELQLEVVRVGKPTERERAFAQAIGLVRSNAGGGRASQSDKVRLTGTDERGDDHAR